MNTQKETLVIRKFLTRLRQFSDPFALAVSGDDISAEKLSDITKLADEIRLVKKEIKNLCPSQVDSKDIDIFFKKWNNMVFGVLYVEENQKKNGNISAREMMILKTALEEIGDYCRSF